MNVYLCRMKRSALLFLLAAILISTPVGAQKRAYRFYPVIRVTDGDTFRIADGSPDGMVIRLIGVDAPETRNTARKVKSEFGAESKKYLEELIGGKKVRLEYDVGHTDQYGRTLAYVYLADGTFVNAELVRNGYANIMTVPPNVKYQELFLKLERRARSREKGMWRQ